MEYDAECRNSRAGWDLDACSGLDTSDPNQLLCFCCSGNDHWFCGCRGTVEPQDLPRGWCARKGKPTVFGFEEQDCRCVNSFWWGLGFVRDAFGIQTLTALMALLAFVEVASS